MRHPIKSSIDKFNGLLGFVDDQYSQDWGIECADPRRVIEFLKCYDNYATTDDDKFTLMGLILPSYEQYFKIYGPDNSHWTEIKNRLEMDRFIHQDHIDYYSCRESNDPDELFPITEQIRRIRESN